MDRRSHLNFKDFGNMSNDFKSHHNHLLNASSSSDASCQFSMINHIINPCTTRKNNKMAHGDDHSVTLVEFHDI